MQIGCIGLILSYQRNYCFVLNNVYDIWIVKCFHGTHQTLLNCIKNTTEKVISHMNRKYRKWYIYDVSWNGNVFCVTDPLCGEFTGDRWIPRTKASDTEFDAFFDLHLNKWLSKQSKRRWFETPSRSSWRHCNDMICKLHPNIWNRSVVCPRRLIHWNGKGSRVDYCVAIRCTWGGQVQSVGDYKVVNVTASPLLC